MRFSVYTDYINEISINLNPSITTDFENFGSVTETQILKDLLGDYLYNLFITDLSNNVPQTQKFTDLLDGKTYTDDNGKICNYDGLKRMLKYYVYCDYKKYIHSVNTTTGEVKPKNELTFQQSISDLIYKSNFADIYNTANGLYLSAVKYIKKFYTTYFTDTSQYSFWCAEIVNKEGIFKVSSTNVNPVNLNRNIDGCIKI